VPRSEGAWRRAKLCRATPPQLDHDEHLQAEHEVEAKVDFAFFDDQAPTTVSRDSTELTSDVRTPPTAHEAFIFPGHDTTGIKHFADRTEMRTIECWPGYEYE
jgi:hypothetical protein